jgi:DNA repair ATPase RecN
LIQDHSPPATDDPLKDFQAALDEALKPAEGGLAFKLPLALSYQTGKPALTEADQLLAAQLIGEIKERAAAFKSNAEQYEALRSALNNYGSLLRKVQQTLSTLVDALDRPQKFEQVSDELFAIVFSLRKDIDAYRAARKSAD